MASFLGSNRRHDAGICVAFVVVSVILDSTQNYNIALGEAFDVSSENE